MTAEKYTGPFEIYVNDNLYEAQDFRFGIDIF